MSMRALVALLAGFVAGTALQLALPSLWPRAVVLVAGALALLALLALLWRLWRLWRLWPAAQAAQAAQAAGAARPAAPAGAACSRPAGRVVAAPGVVATTGLALAAAALGFALAHERAAQRLAEALDPALEGVDLVVEGRVAELPREGLAGTRFVFEVDRALQRGAEVRVPPRLSLGWFRGPDDDALVLGAPEPLRAGQHWRLPVRLKRPHGGANPHGFDLELYLFERGIGATGSVRARAAVPAVRLGADACCRIERVRQWVRDAIERRVGDPGAAGVLAALAIDDQAAIEREDWELFRITGVAHLMSISGLHVTMLAWAAGALVGAAWRRSARLALALPAPAAARWGGLAAALGYALVAGWGVPAQRTVWMLAARGALRTLGLRWPLHLALLAAAALVVALDPWALLAPGFWLSFVAVALLAAGEPDRPPAAAGAAARLGAAVAGGLRTQAVATVGLAPLSLLFFQQLSLVGFAANLIAIPLVTLVVTPLALAGVLLAPLWSLAAAVLAALRAVLELLALPSLAVWHAAAATPAAAACGLLGGVLAVLPLPWRLRLLSLPLLLPLALPPVERPPPGRFELVAADIGQGTAVLVRTASRLLLYDTGPRYGADTDAGQRVLLPLLRARGERALDLLVLSHGDTDHVGGAATLLAALPVRRMASSLDEGHPLRAGGVPHERCLAGGRWQWDGVDFAWLHPTPADFAPGARPNALSCVLRVSVPGRSVLLTGDIEAPQEGALRAREGPSLAADVLLVPHHGSLTSSTAGFLDAVAPQVALVQAGYRSRYGHPAAAVLRRHAERGIAVVRSDRCGAFTLGADGSTRCERGAARRYWHHPDGEAAPGLR
ncbi:MAG: DNA internalization-related competence protein ComEC/Rec2 [Pseudomonadota bacterium]